MKRPSDHKEMERLIYQSRKAFAAKKVKAERVNIIYLRMSYLLAKMDTDSVADK